jgi:hypothetical protein
VWAGKKYSSYLYKVAEIMALRNYSCTQPLAYRLVKKDCDTVDGFRNQNSMVFLTQNLHFNLTKHGSSLCGYVISQNNRCWSTENAHAVHEVLLHDLKSGIWCAVGA